MTASPTPPDRVVDIFRRGIGLLNERLPSDWEAVSEAEGSTGQSPSADALVLLKSRDGTSAQLVIKVKRTLEAREVAWVSEQLGHAAEAVSSGRATDSKALLVPMVVARYLAPRTRERLRELGLSYIDTTGNIEVAVDSPALFVRDVGAQRDPWRGPGRPRGSFRGAVPGRVVRALADFAPPMTVLELVERAGTSVGATYRMVELLGREAYIEREHRGPITAVDWRRMIERWSQDYGFASSNPAVSFLEPRGLSELLDRLRAKPDLRYALTGSIAASFLSRYAPARLGMVYVDDLETAADALKLRPVETGANVLLATPLDDFVYERSQDIDGLRVAAPSQVVVDLLTSPGRGPSEASALFDWMQDNEAAWRGPMR